MKTPHAGRSGSGKIEKLARLGATRQQDTADQRADHGASAKEIMLVHADGER